VDSGYQRHRSDSPAVDDQQVPENARRPADLLAAQPGSAKLVIVPIGLICASCPAGCVLPGGVGKEALDHPMERLTAGPRVHDEPRLARRADHATTGLVRPEDASV